MNPISNPISNPIKHVPPTATIICTINPVTSDSVKDSGNSLVSFKYLMKLRPDSSPLVTLSSDPATANIITVTAPRNAPVQLNFQLNEGSRSNILGIYFSAPDFVVGGTNFGTNEFPAMALSRSATQLSLVMVGNLPVVFVVPPQTLGVIDMNLLREETVPYTFAIIVQSPGPEDIGSVIGVIDPDIINKPQQ